MALPPKKDHRIPLTEAAELTRGHRSANAAEPKGHLFHREAFETILAQPGCSAIRIYRGRGKGGEHHLVLVGVDGQGNDMTAAGVMEKCYPCPPYCDEASALGR